ncbi:phage capsid protein [Magnetospira sp. QH-2]|uniref:phage capsid protein n=1 Tax=Magnetospira sp. (strain QH-2) TaxID=1288970 RepID=UPI0003E811D8|nr:phage capsid protein [Magnetospira sp. QH-2]CCQ72331.1 conserved protein of unknown function [Magnetospira sp. QH-2]
MTVTVDQHFVKQYSLEVQQNFQRMGSKLRNTVRTKNKVQGSTYEFKKVGKGEATVKARHGKVPVMNLDHETISVSLSDFYAGEWIDKLDEIKVNHDERAVAARAGAYALGRKTDDLIIGSLDTATAAQNAGTNADGLTKDKVLEAFEMLGAGDVPDDGQRYAIVGWKQWSDLLGIAEFADSDYVGAEDLPWKGTQAKQWLGALWMPHSGLPLNGTTRNCFWYHKTAVGHAIGQEIQADFTWHGDRAAFFVNNMMSMGCGLIDETGVVRMPCLES